MKWIKGTAVSTGTYLFLLTSFAILADYWNIPTSSLPSYFFKGIGQVTAYMLLFFAITAPIAIVHTIYKMYKHNK